MTAALPLSNDPSDSDARQLAAEIDALRLKYGIPVPVPETHDEAVERIMFDMLNGERETKEAMAKAQGSADQVAEPRGEHAGIADAVMANIYGGRDAQQLLQALRDGCAPADLLLEVIDQVLATQDRGRLQGFARELQKRLERGG